MVALRSNELSPTLPGDFRFAPRALFAFRT
jgi:hypothetical protein